MVTDFTDPKGFVSDTVYEYFDGVRKPAKIKQLPVDFEVLEPAYGRPGCFVSMGRETDYPGGAINYPYGKCPSGLETTAMPWYGYAPVTPGVTADRVTAAILTVNDGNLDTALRLFRTKLGLDKSCVRYRELPARNGKLCFEVVVEGYQPEDMRRKILGEEPYVITDVQGFDGGPDNQIVTCLVTPRAGMTTDLAIDRLRAKLGLEPDKVTTRRINKPGRKGRNGETSLERLEITVRGLSPDEFRKRMHGPDPYRVEHQRFAYMVIVTLQKERLTTMSAIDWLCVTLSKLLNREIRCRRISNSGLKDRWAVTAQHIVIEGATVEEISRCIQMMPPYAPGRAGLALKDARHAYARLYKGDHKTNRFKIVVRTEMTAEQIEEYLQPRLAKLKRRGMWIPNAFGRQRLGRRQNLHVIGRTLVTNDFKAPAGVHNFGSASEAACYRFLCETTSSEPIAAGAVRKQAEGMWLYNFRDMKSLFEQNYRQLNLAFEFKMADRIADVDRYDGSFERVIDSMWDECSLFVAAWQSWWWNRVLARKMYAWVREMDAACDSRHRKDGIPCTCNGASHDCQDEESSTECQACKCARCSQWVPSFNPGKKSIPILMATPQARSYYGHLHYAQDSVRELNKADSDVREMFLVPRNRDGSPKEYGPWRKAFIRVENMESKSEDGVWTTQFDLRAGAYATNFLQLVWFLIDPEANAVKPGVEMASPNDIEEITD